MRVPLSARQVAGITIFVLLTLSMVVMPPQIRPSSSAAHFVDPEAKNVLLEDAPLRKPNSRSEDTASEEGSAVRRHVSRSGRPLPPGHLNASSRAPPPGLSIFIVFHTTLVDQFYRALRIPDAASHKDDVSAAGDQEGTAAHENASTIAENRGITFLATNPQVAKRYNTSHSLYRNRVVNEWDMVGYDRHILTTLNEFGAMLSVFRSNWTGAIGRSSIKDPGSSSSESVASSTWDTPPRDLEGGVAAPTLVGFLQYDMRIGNSLLEAMHSRLQVEHEAWRRRMADSPATWVKFSAKHRAEGKLRCCVFYAISYPTAYLLANPVGRSLLKEYNRFYRTSLTLGDLHHVGVLDAFVIPTAMFNRVMPFLSFIMHGLSSAAAVRGGPNASSLPATHKARASLGGWKPWEIPGQRDGTVTAAAPDGVAGGEDDPDATPTGVMEKALALALAAERGFRFVQIPVRHERVVS